MTTAELVEHLKAEAMKLPEKERLMLALDLEESLTGDGSEYAEPISPGWKAELQRRADAVRSGRALGRAPREVIDEIRAKVTRR
jgi:putative addiction module component (TIGR02574 family)